MSKSMRQVNLRVPLVLYNRIQQEAKALNLTVSSYIRSRMSNTLDVQISRMRAFDGAKLLLAKLSQEERAQIMEFYCPICWLPREICIGCEGFDQ